MHQTIARLAGALMTTVDESARQIAIGPRASVARRAQWAWATVVIMSLALLAGGCASPAASAGPAGATPSAGASIGAPSPTSGRVPSSHSPDPSSGVPLLGTLPTGSLDPARATALQAVLEMSVAGGAPDVIAAVITADGVWSGAAGIGGPDSRKATASDEFAIASVTKMFTATLILRLAEAGRIDLDAPLSSYMGDLKADTNGATVRQTLGMMGGFAEDAPNASDAIHVDVRHDWTPAELVKAYGPPVAKPGTTYLYSNPGYALLAIAAEHVTGKSFAAALRAEVLDPVGAARVLEQGSAAATPKPWALPTLEHAGTYKQTELGTGGALPCLSSATYSIGGSSMASDAPSLAAWTWRLFNGEVVDGASLEAMMTIGNNGYGLGMERLNGLTPTAYGHTGAKTGYGSIVAMFPTEHAVVVVFANDPDYIVEPTVLQLLTAARRA